MPSICQDNGAFMDHPMKEISTQNKLKHFSRTKKLAKLIVHWQDAIVTSKKHIRFNSRDTCLPIMSVTTVPKTVSTGTTTTTDTALTGVMIENVLCIELKNPWKAFKSKEEAHNKAERFSGTATMITPFNDASFELDKNLLELGLEVFRPIVERNDAFDKLASPLPPLPGVAPIHHKTSSSLCQPSRCSFSCPFLSLHPSRQCPLRKCWLIWSFWECLLHWAITCPQLCQDKHQINRWAIRNFEFAVAIQLAFKASVSKALNICKMLSTLCNEVAMVATDQGYLGWIGHMFVTAYQVLYEFIIKIWIIQAKFVAVEHPASMSNSSRGWIPALPTMFR